MTIATGGKKTKKQRPNKRKQQTLLHVGAFGRGDVAGGFFEKRKQQGEQTKQKERPKKNRTKQTTENKLNDPTTTQGPNEGSNKPFNVDFCSGGCKKFF
jgi:hypothetical protein